MIGLRNITLSVAFGLALTTVALAETVNLKYAGPVNLDTFRCENTVSSFVNRVCYQPAARYVIVLLRATYYHYCEVDPGTVTNWLGADSKGRFYNQNIKGRFDCRNATVPQFP
jgi:hypothetical protein